MRWSIWCLVWWIWSHKNENMHFFSLNKLCLKQSLLRSHWKKVRGIEKKSTPTPLKALLTIIIDMPEASDPSYQLEYRIRTVHSVLLHIIVGANFSPAFSKNEIFSVCQYSLPNNVTFYPSPPFIWIIFPLIPLVSLVALWETKMSHNKNRMSSAH